MRAVEENKGRAGLTIVVLCAALAVARATFYRRRRGPLHTCRPAPARALSSAERQAVLDQLHEPRFVDLAPREVYATLLDENRYLCSVSTMYRLLRWASEVRERRAQARRVAYRKPELVATAPNQLWSWDITKLMGPAKWTYFYLYVILDVFSRYVVGWMIAERESAALAAELIAETCRRQGIQPGQLNVHADRGKPMTSLTLAQKLADLGVNKTHSRPHVSDDNPFSEAQFKTLKYRPDFPERFGSAQDARSFFGDLFPWYNTEHHHVGLGLHTPHDVHYGLAHDVRQRRSLVLAAAHQLHPERFVRGVPTPPALPAEVWINPPSLVAAAGSGDGASLGAGGLPAVPSESAVRVPGAVGTEAIGA
jgi:putative transposase